MINNGGTYDICYSSISEARNTSLLGVIKHGAALSILLFIEQEYERIVFHRSQYNKWEEKFCPNSCHGHILRLINNSTSFPEPIIKPSRDCD